MTFLQITEIIISLLLIFFILIQNKNVSLNISTMSGGMGPVKKRGPEKVLHIITIFLSVAFIVNSLLLYVV